MKKTFKFSILIIIIISFFISCKQYNDDLEEFFDYWTNTAEITASNIDKLAKENSLESKGKNAQNIYCLNSQKDINFEFAVRNPKKFTLQTAICKPLIV